MHSNTLVPQSQAGCTNRLSRKDRLFRVQLGVAAGKSNREIARQLRVDEGTVRRDRRTLLLSQQEIQAVKAGAAVEPLLRHQERRKAATAREKQEAAERESRFLTNRLSKLITVWLNGFPLIAADKVHVVREVDPRSWYHQNPLAPPVPESKIKATIESAKPSSVQPKEVYSLINYAKAWLFSWIISIEPDREVRDRALANVRQALERENPGW